MSTPQMTSVSDVAASLGVGSAKVAQLIRERQVLAVRERGEPKIPVDFVQDGAVVKGLPATITLLTDAGYSDAEIISWLYAADETLPGTPIEALRANRGTEVKRRAQAAGY